MPSGVGSRSSLPFTGLAFLAGLAPFFAACASASKPPPDAAAPPPEPSMRVLKGDEIPEAMRSKIFPRTMPGLPTEKETLAKLNTFFATLRPPPGKPKAPPGRKLHLERVAVEAGESTCHLTFTYFLADPSASPPRNDYCSGLIDMKTVTEIAPTTLPNVGRSGAGSFGLVFHGAERDRTKCALDLPLGAATAAEAKSHPVVETLETWRTLCGAPGTKPPQ